MPSIGRPAKCASVYPPFRDLLPRDDISDGNLEVSFATTESQVASIQRLRYDVFNLELGEGFDHAHVTLRDEDAFDECCHHLMLIDRPTGRVVGTYRMQTREMVERGLGFYSATEFDLSGLPDTVLDEAVEVGRACIATGYRSIRALHLLWQGLGAYLRHNEKRYLFGCCSLTSQACADGWDVMSQLRDSGHVHREYSVQPHPKNSCAAVPSDGMCGSAVETDRVRIPRLMRAYISLGARVCSLPAIDREFGTIDFLTILDVQALGNRLLAFYRAD